MSRLIGFCFVIVFIAFAAVSLAVTRDIVIVHKSKPIAYFGFYRANQMTGDGWTLFDRTVDWARPAGAPNTQDVFLATYNGTLNPNSHSAELGGIAVYNNLVARGFNVTVGAQATIETGNFAAYDLVVYAWSYPRDATNVVNQGKPFVTFSAGETDELGIGTGAEMMHEYRDNSWVIDNAHSITSPYALGVLTFPNSMFMDATSASGFGRPLIRAEAVTITGFVNLDSYVASPENIEFNVKAKSGALVLDKMTALLASDSSYVVYTNEVGPYHLWGKCTHWLSETLPEEDYEIGGVYRRNFDLLRNGDVDESNAVNLPDMNSIFIAFASAGPAPEDLDGDGIVALPDLNLTFLNFGQVGAE